MISASKGDEGDALRNVGFTWLDSLLYLATAATTASRAGCGPTGRRPTPPRGTP